MAKVFIGNIKGPQGEQGPKGEQGVQGIQGPQGERGPAGMGIPGSAGQVIGFNEAGEPIAQDMPEELGYLDGVTSNIQEQLDGKQATITGGVSNVVTTNFSASRAIVSNSNGKLASSAVTSTELGYLDGVTSNVQTQLNGKYSSTNKPSFSDITGTLAAASQLSGKVPLANGGTGADLSTGMKKGAVIRKSVDSENFWYTNTASGALYATAAETAPKFGTLPVAQGGTGATTLTSGAALIGNGTGAVAFREIANNTKSTYALTASEKLVNMNTLSYALNRTTGPESADTNYATPMMRAIKASTTDLTAGTSTLLSGQIYLVYE